MGTYLSIRQAAKKEDCPVNEFTLRRMVKSNQVPGFYSGRKYLIDYEEFLRLLKEKSKANASGLIVGSTDSAGVD